MLTVDDLPWWWGDVSDLNTIDLAGLPAGQHKVLIELVNLVAWIEPCGEAPPAQDHCRSLTLRWTVGIRDEPERFADLFERPARRARR